MVVCPPPEASGRLIMERSKNDIDAARGRGSRLAKDLSDVAVTVNTKCKSDNTAKKEWQMNRTTFLYCRIKIKGKQITKGLVNQR